MAGPISPNGMLERLRAAHFGMDFTTLWSAWRTNPTVVSLQETDFITALCDWTIVISIAVFLVLQFVTAPYGRHAGNMLGPLLGPGLPGRLAWILQEIPVLVIPSAMILFSADWTIFSHTGNQVILGMLLFHYFNRSLIFPFQMRDPKPTPIGVWFLAFAWCNVNGYMHGRLLCNLQVYDDKWLTHPQFLVGMALFLFGFFANYQADDILRNLRKPGQMGYFIPYGGLFEYVSAANYLAEIIEWAGFVIATNFAYPSIAFLMFVLANLVPRGVSNHQWYLSKFKGEYPKTRKAIIPFVL